MTGIISPIVCANPFTVKQEEALGRGFSAVIPPAPDARDLDRAADGSLDTPE